MSEDDKPHIDEAEPQELDAVDEPNDEEQELETEVGPEEADDDGAEEDEDDSDEEDLEDDDDGAEEDDESDFEDPSLPPGVAGDVDDDISD